jgi:hypothetical protein
MRDKNLSAKEGRTQLLFATHGHEAQQILTLAEQDSQRHTETPPADSKPNGRNSGKNRRTSKSGTEFLLCNKKLGKPMGQGGGGGEPRSAGLFPELGYSVLFAYFASSPATPTQRFFANPTILQ